MITMAFQLRGALD